MHEELRRLETGSSDKMRQLDEVVIKGNHRVSVGGRHQLMRNFDCRSEESKTRRGRPFIEQVTKEESLTFQSFQEMILLNG